MFVVIDDDDDIQKEKTMVMVACFAALSYSTLPLSIIERSLAIWLLVASRRCRHGEALVDQVVRCTTNLCFPWLGVLLRYDTPRVLARRTPSFLPIPS